MFVLWWVDILIHGMLSAVRKRLEVQDAATKRILHGVIIYYSPTRNDGKWSMSCSSAWLPPEVSALSVVHLRCTCVMHRIESKELSLKTFGAFTFDGAANWKRMRSGLTDRLNHESQLIAHVIIAANLKERRVERSSLASRSEALNATTLECLPRYGMDTLHHMQTFLPLGARSDSKLRSADTGRGWRPRRVDQSTYRFVLSEGSRVGALAYPLRLPLRGP